MRSVSSKVPRKQFYTNRRCLREVTLILFELIFHSLFNTVARLLRMQVEEHFDTFMFMPVLHVIYYESLNTTSHLL